MKEGDLQAIGDFHRVVKNYLKMKKIQNRETMKTELTPQIAALYLGCKLTGPNQVIGTLTGICNRADGTLPARVQTQDNEHTIWYDFDEIKLHLRKLESMTEEERTEISWLPDREPLMFFPKEFSYLLSKSFDLFNLIDSGHAIEKARPAHHNCIEDYNQKRKR